MNAISQLPMPQVSPGEPLASRPAQTAKRIELCCFAALILILNSPLLPAAFVQSLTFQTQAVLQGGQWWRVFTYPFIHVSWFQLLLDAAAFLGLYDSLDERRASARFFHVAASTAGSLLVPLLSAPLIYTHGLCGLSGPAHGLMAIVALELITKHRDDPLLFRSGILCFAGLATKCIVEAIIGRPIFEALYFGLVGTPIVSCHAGGMLGGIASFVLLTLLSGRKTQGS